MDQFKIYMRQHIPHRLGICVTIRQTEGGNETEEGFYSSVVVVVAF